MHIVATALEAACAEPLVQSRHSAATSRRHRDVVEAARSELHRTFRTNHSVHDVARAVGQSVFHLSRIFRAHTGLTMHAYRTELRLRAALELLEGSSPNTATLSGVAFELGFASHSHFVVAMKKWGAGTPSEVREAIAANL